jgi:hypothetical protein
MIFEEMEKQVQDWVRNWFNSELNPDEISDLFRDYSVRETELGKRGRLRLWTQRNRYTITFGPSSVESYLGCVAVNRFWRIGEDWHRGSDLPDGKFCEETWDRIMKGILAYELQTPPEPKVCTVPLPERSSQEVA